MRTVVSLVVLAVAAVSIAGAVVLLRGGDGDASSPAAPPEPVIETDATVVLAKASDFLSRVGTYRATPTGLGSGALEIFLGADGRGYARSTSTRGRIEYFIRADKMWVSIEGGRWEPEDHLLRGLTSAHLPDAILGDKAAWPLYALEGVEACGPQRCYRLVRPLEGATKSSMVLLIGVTDFVPRAMALTTSLQPGSTLTVSGATYDAFGQPIAFPVNLPP